MKYHFDEFVLDTESRNLYRGQQQCALEPLAFDVLLHLCSNPHHLVTSDALYERHWPNVVVTPNSLTRVIAQIRKVLGDDHRAPRFIETIPKTGYRFIADVKQAKSDSQAKDFTFHRWVALIVILCTLFLGIALWPSNQQNREPITLVVFPFESEESIDFTDSFSQELLEEFYAVTDIKLRSFLTAEQALLELKEPLKAAASIGASHYITGKVEQVAKSKELIFYTELIETDTSHVVWSQRSVKSFDSQASWPVEVRSKVLEALVGLPIQSFDAPAMDSPAPEAYRLYLKAKYIWLQRGKRPMSEAVYLLKEATTIDPKFAAAWDSLAAALISWGTYEDVPETVEEDARAAAKQAIKLDPSVSFSYFLLYQEAYNAKNYPQAFEYAKKMKSNAPNNAMAVYWYSNALRELGHMDDSMVQLREAVEIDPTIWVPLADFAVTIMHATGPEPVDQTLNQLWNEGARALWLWRAIFQAKLLSNQLQSMQNWRKEVELSGAYKHLVELEMEYANHKRVNQDALVALMEDETLSQVDHRTVIFSLHYMQQADLFFEYVNSLIDTEQGVAIYALAVLSPPFINDPRMIKIFARLELLDYWQQNSVDDFCVYDNQQWRCNQYQYQLTQKDKNILKN